MVKTKKKKKKKNHYFGVFSQFQRIWQIAKFCISSLLCIKRKFLAFWEVMFNRLREKMRHFFCTVEAEVCWFWALRVSFSFLVFNSKFCIFLLMLFIIQARLVF